MPKKYVRVKDRRQGLAVKNRTPSKTIKNANQWTSDPRHDLFATYWLTPQIDGKRNELFGNAYQSAVKAGFSPHHSKQITSNVLSLQWVKEAKSRLASYNPEHIVKKLERYTDSAKDSDAIRALEVLARVKGMFIDKQINLNYDVTFENSVPRPHIDAQRDPTTDVKPTTWYLVCIHTYTPRLTMDILRRTTTSPLLIDHHSLLISRLILRSNKAKPWGPLKTMGGGSVRG